MEPSSEPLPNFIWISKYVYISSFFFLKLRVHILKYFFRFLSNIRILCPSRQIYPTATLFHLCASTSAVLVACCASRQRRVLQFLSFVLYSFVLWFILACIRFLQVQAASGLFNVQGRKNQLERTERVVPVLKITHAVFCR